MVKPTLVLTKFTCVAEIPVTDGKEKSCHQNTNPEHHISIVYMLRKGDLGNATENTTS